MLPADETRPSLAAQACLTRALTTVPRRRGVTAALVAHGDLPGLAAPPWALRGMLDAVDRARLQLRDVTTLGDPETGQRLFERASFGHEAGQMRPTTPQHDDGIRLKLPESMLPARVPSAWVGTNLVVVAPLCHQRRRGGGWSGPMSTAARQLARGLGFTSPSDPAVAIGARLISDVFATATFLIDATWWAAADQDGGLACDPTAPEHVMAVSCSEPEDLMIVDAWLDGLLNLSNATPTHRQGDEEVPFVSGRRRPWPIARLPHRRITAEGLAGRAVKALWGTRSVPATVRAALRPVVPGKFSSAWSSYRPVNLDAPHSA